MGTQGPCPSSEEAKHVRILGVLWGEEGTSTVDLVQTLFAKLGRKLHGSQPRYSCCTYNDIACRTDTICHHLGGSTSTWAGGLPVDSLPPTLLQTSHNHLSRWKDTVQTQTGERETAFYPPVQAPTDHRCLQCSPASSSPWLIVL